MRKTLPAFRATRDQSGEKTIFVPVRSHLWSEVGLDSFRKCYDVLLDYYAEPSEKSPPLLEMVHIGWYCKLQRMFWRNEAFTLREVEQRYGTHRETFTRYIDRLEDVELLDREKCVDLRGQPVDLLLRTPYPPARFIQERPRLVERVNEKDDKKQTIGHTAAARKRAGGSKGNGYPARELSIKDRMARIEAQAQNANLEKMQEVINHVMFVNVGRGDAFTEKDFVEQIKTACVAWGVYYSDPLLRDAIGQFRKR